MMKNRLPSWFKQEIPDKTVLNRLELLKKFKSNTVCQEGLCPNLTNCFKRGELTFMILGSHCTRQCRFCAVEKTKLKSLPLDSAEPENIKKAVKKLDLKYVVITSVTRDDLTDGGAGQFRKTIEALRKINKSIKIEVLIPDFLGSLSALKTIVEVHPEVIAHNLETVPRFYPSVRQGASYSRSLNLLKKIKELDNLITKSSLILGMGEKEQEVLKVIEDLVCVKIDILTLGQYLAPSPQHYPVKEFISAEQFNRYKDIALDSGIKAVLSEPLARSSYQAEQLYTQAVNYV